MSHLAFKLEDSRYKEDKGTSNPFNSDVAAILGSEIFKSLSGKIQVFNRFGNPNISTRAVHTFRMCALAIKLAEQLGLRVPLVEAISFGHDVCHPPLGHAGERAIKEVTFRDYFHNASAVVWFQKVEKKNLTYPVQHGIWRHGFKHEHLPNETREGMLVKHCDFLDYLPHDTVEALSLGYLTVADLPPLLKEFIRHGVFDWESWERFLIDEIVKECEQVGDFSFSKSDFAKAIWETREKYYNEIYNRLDWEEDKLIAKKILEYFQETFDCDPALPYCALTMEQCYQIHDKLKTNGQLNIHELRSLGFTDWTRNMKDLNFREPDFNWAEIPVGK